MFTYDADGNLTGDGMWTYTYNAENQLVRITSALASGFGSELEHVRQMIDFKYDYASRRVEKKVTNMATLTSTTRRYVYDGWNLIAELDGAGTEILRSYTWGLDIGGGLSATSSPGSLLQITNYSAGAPTTSYYPVYDGQGNVTSLVNASTGVLAAIYEYDPYGNLIRNQTHDQAVADNPFRFSTKYQDLETGLVYYGKRYYSATLGRFINRDPIGEAGGMNLYGFAGNNSVNGYDVLGMYTVNEIYDDAPDPDVYRRLHPGYKRINENTWYDPSRDHRIVFLGWGGRGDDGGHQYNAYADEDMGINASFGAAIWAADDAAEAAWYGSLEATVADMVATANEVWDVIDTNRAKAMRAAYEAAEAAAAKEESARIAAEIENGPRLAASGGVTGLGAEALPPAKPVLTNPYAPGQPLIGGEDSAANHHSRNAENDAYFKAQGIYGRTDLSLSEIRSIGVGMKQASAAETKYHRQGPENANNLKFTSMVSTTENWWQRNVSNRYGRYEIVVRPNGDGTYTHVKDSVNMGTLNRGNNPISHVLLDVLPYKRHGNVPD